MQNSTYLQIAERWIGSVVGKPERQETQQKFIYQEIETSSTFLQNTEEQKEETHESSEKSASDNKIDAIVQEEYEQQETSEIRVLPVSQELEEQQADAL